MLRELYIKNIAVIDEIRLNFGSGFHIFTGETGAGKSILVEAIGLVLGEKVKSTLIRDGSSEALVEAVFDVARASDVLDLLSQHGFSSPDEPGELILKRQLGQNGNNRIFVNHQRATLEVTDENGNQVRDSMVLHFKKYRSPTLTGKLFGPDELKSGEKGLFSARIEQNPLEHLTFNWSLGDPFSGAVVDSRAPLKTTSGYDFSFLAATSSDFEKSPQRSVPYTSPGFFLIILVSLKNLKSRFRN